VRGSPKEIAVRIGFGGAELTDPGGIAKRTRENHEKLEVQTGECF
jgi:hypothetical protein